MLEQILAQHGEICKALNGLDESYRQIAAINTAHLAMNVVMFAWQATGRKELTQAEFNTLMAEAMKNMGVPPGIFPYPATAEPEQ
jgi:hypothetical protein